MARRRIRIHCRGAVQGVGFRPTVHRLAVARGLAGWVANDPDGATAEVEGEAETIGSFPGELEAALPPLARLDDMTIEELAVEGASDFEVSVTEQGRRAGALVPPDAALCDDCRREMNDEGDRRHRYPFTTCTNCGPRYSLVLSLPYDRPATAMGCFPLCPDCEREYTDTSDRRFHAEPVCCPRCGPRLWLVEAGSREMADGAGAVTAARDALLDGRIVAIKGLGGFQLACRADDGGVVAELRTRKRRPTKPFAVMVRDLATARRLVELTPDDEQLMESPRAPVVLGRRREPLSLAEEVAPDISDLGVMLTTTPLHVELLRDSRMPPLVMTSANLSEEPICRSNREAVERLSDIADLFLLHDRDVVRRVDDSVVRSTAIGPVLVRRARGWVPEPLPLPVEAAEPLLAVGGHLQVTACVATGGQAFLSQHVGDLDSEAARLFHREVIAGFEEFLQVEPRLVVADAHPDYPSSWLARELVDRRDGRLLEVQHHLAHAAAVLAEHSAFPRPGSSALAISLDGTGWGPDGTAWGGEWLQIDGDLGWRRLGSLEPLPLVGGDMAVREPWRVAVAALAVAGDAELAPQTPLAEVIDGQRIRQIARLATSGSWPMASGAGRLFEAAGALLGPVAQNDWEGEAAVRLESLAERAATTAPVAVDEFVDGRSLQIRTARLLAATARRVAGGATRETAAAELHTTFCSAAVELTRRVAPQGIRSVALGGGCMVNRLLLDGLVSGLEAAGFEPLVARRVPPGDGGLAYGQAVLAAVASALGRDVPIEPVSS